MRAVSVHTKEARGLELYETHPVATRALMLNERLPYAIWEASCGRGAIARVLRRGGHRVYASDIKDYGSPDQDYAGVDFLKQESVPDGIDAIVQNPPFSMAALFALKSIRICPMVYMLLPLRFLESGNEKTEAGRARLEVLDAGYLARVLVFRERLPMMHRDGWTGPKATSNVAYAWFVFSRYHRGDALVSRISWHWEDWMPPI